ncbi:hypothetical protein L7F22_051015 [Adiantum nelumboides]|nr:hypothetical protein [Adiantum nelumboides]
MAGGGVAGGQATAGTHAAPQQVGGAGATSAGPPPKSEMSTMLQQLNLDSIRTRSHDLFTAISSILQSFQTIPHHRWPEVLGQFSMVNVELLNLVEDIKPILRMFVVHPKNVNAENSQMLPVMLSSKLLPEMESEEAALKEQILAGVSNLPLQLQTEKLQKQIAMVTKACEFAEKALTENRKLYGLGSRQVPAINPPLDKAQAAKIAEQEKLLRAAVNMGEVGEGSSQAEETFRMQLVNDVIFFKQLTENPRFMEFLQSPLIAHQAQEYPPLSEHVEAQFQVPIVSQKGKEHSHARESCETSKANLSVHGQVVRTPVLQVIPVQLATLVRPNVGSNGQEIMFQDMHQVFPPSTAHFGYFGGGSVFQSMAGYALENQLYMPGTVFGGVHDIVPNPMYADIGLQPGFQGTQGQFGVSQGNLGMAGFSIPPVNDT